jgi:hypothetical protein
MTSSLPFSVKGAAHLAKTALLPAAPRSGSPTMA